MSVELPAGGLVSPSRPVAAGETLPVDEWFDVSFADEIARLESYNKHHYRPNTYLHKWWARRCGSTFRLILKHLVGEREQRDYYAPGGLAGKVILDPMMGGGTTLHEALRLGANVVGIDIDPIPVVQARATLSDVPLPLLEAAFARLRRGLVETVAPCFQTRCPHCAESGPLRFTLYGARRHCACGPALLVDTLVLRRERGGPTIRLCSRCHRVLRGAEVCACHAGRPEVPLVEKNEAACSICGEAYAEALDVPYYARYRPLVIVGHCSTHGLFFSAPRPEDEARLALADGRRPDLGERAAFAVMPGPKSRDLLSRGVDNYLDLFSSRQLLYLERAMALLPQFDSLIRLNLALLISTSLEFNSLMCSYKGARGTGTGDRPGAIRHTFSYHAYTFPYTALENNPLFPQKASGTLEKLFHDRIRRARRWALHPRERNLNGEKARFRVIEGEQDVGVEAGSAGELDEGTRRFFLRQGSAAHLPLADGSVDYVVTDPPYYDSVQYGDLATFFRVWLQRLAPEAARWHYDLSEAAVDPLTNGNGNGRYAAILGQIFGECRRVLRPEGRLIFTFHNWKPRGWAALTLALQEARFVLVNRYVVHSENPISVHIANMRALTHDAILVLAPDTAGVAGAWRRPASVDKEESARFCEDCATLLGALLQERLNEAAVTQVWAQMLATD